MKSLKFLATSLMISSVLAFTAACGNNAGTDKAEENKQASEEKQLQGEVAVDGSSTVYPIMEAAAEEYMAEQPNVNVSVGFAGTGGGFEKFIAGETVISNASRPIKDEEKAQLEKKGIEYTEIQIAYDGLSVVVNKENDWVDKLSIEDLKKMWTEDGKPKKWSDINPEWPDKEIKFYSPGHDSGTYDYFDEVVLGGAGMVKTATLSEDDNVLVQGVTGDKNAIGYFGYAYYLENKDKLKVVPIVNSKGEAVEPSNKTIQSGTYEPLSRPLFIYVNNKAIKEQPQVADFVQYLLQNAGSYAEEVGYVSLPQEKYDEALKTFEGLK
jgi:phosphate transport system substrate-binding protein